MKIIRNGNINTYTNTCPICSCYYEYDDADVNIGYELTSTGRYGFVTCPCCHNMNRVSYNFKDDYSYPYYNPLTRYNIVDCCSHQELSCDCHSSDYPDIKCETEDADDE